MKLLKQTADFPNTIFIAAFDYNKVSQIIVRKYHQEYAGYLPKIINKRIRLDSFSYQQLEAIFVANTKRYLTKTIFDKKGMF